MACLLLVAKRTDRDSGAPRAYVFLKLFVQRAAETKVWKIPASSSAVRSFPIDDTTTGRRRCRCFCAQLLSGRQGSSSRDVALQQGPCGAGPLLLAGVTGARSNSQCVPAWSPSRRRRDLPTRGLIELVRPRAAGYVLAVNMLFRSSNWLCCSNPEPGWKVK